MVIEKEYMAMNTEMLKSQRTVLRCGCLLLAGLCASCTSLATSRFFPPPIRLAATKCVKDEHTLLGIVKDKRERGPVRIEALKRLGKPGLVRELAQRDGNERVRKAATLLSEDPELLIRVARTDPSVAVRKDLVREIGDVEVLHTITKEEPDWRVRYNAVAGIREQGKLRDVARSEEHDRVALYAYKKARVLCPQFLTEMVRTARSAAVRGHAVGLVTDRAVLRHVLLHDPSGLVRLGAARRMAEPTPGFLPGDVAEDRYGRDYEVGESLQVWADAVMRITSLGVPESPADVTADQLAFRNVVAHDSLRYVRLAALRRIKNPSQRCLADFLKNAEKLRVAAEILSSLVTPDLVAEVESGAQDENVRNLAGFWRALLDESMVKYLGPLKIAVLEWRRTRDYLEKSGTKRRGVLVISTFYVFVEGENVSREAVFRVDAPTEHTFEQDPDADSGTAPVECLKASLDCQRMLSALLRKDLTPKQVEEIAASSGNEFLRSTAEQVRTAADAE